MSLESVLFVLYPIFMMVYNISYCFHYLFFTLDLQNDASLRENMRQFQIDPNENFGLQHFTYNNDALLNNIFGHLSDTNFDGLVV